MVAETVWDTPERQKYLSETIVEHLYRQGMLSVAEDLCQVRFNMILLKSNTIIRLQISIFFD